MCQKSGVKLNKEHRRDHVPNLVETTHKTTETILWNRKVKNGRTIANKSDFIIRDNKNGRCLLTDGTFLGDRNVIKKGVENF
jgi:hypothetical protein